MPRREEHADEIAGAVPQVESAWGNCRIQIEMIALSAAVVVIETIMKIHCRCLKKLSFVRVIILGGESVRRLRQYTKEYFSETVGWIELYTAIYLNPAKIFQLVGSGVKKKQQGLRDESFIELLLGDSRAIELGQIRLAEPEHLMALLRKPFGKGSNIKMDPSQMQVQYSKTTKTARRDGPHCHLLLSVFGQTEG